jgi:hypothetical protein
LVRNIAAITWWMPDAEATPDDRIKCMAMRPAIPRRSVSPRAAW